MRTHAVVLAGGTGQRLGTALPKQLIEVGGRPILAHAVAAFDAHPDIDSILVVMAADHVADAGKVVGRFGKVAEMIEGGTTRTGSTLAALDALAGEPATSRVLIHDAARPFVDGGIIGRTLAGLESYEAVAVGVPSPDTIVTVEDGLVVRMPPRESLRRFQTPQGFRLGTLRLAYERALADPELCATDDCGIVHRFLPDVPIRVVAGNERNLKITHPLDMVIADHLAGEDAGDI